MTDRTKPGWLGPLWQPDAARTKAINKLLRAQRDEGATVNRLDFARLAEGAGISPMAALAILEGRVVSTETRDAVAKWLDE